MNKTSKIILTGLFVALLSSGLPNFVTQDAFAVAATFSTLHTGDTAGDSTATTTLDLVFNQKVYVDDGAGGNADGASTDIQAHLSLNGGAAGAGIASAIVLEEEGDSGDVNNFPTTDDCGANAATVVITLDTALTTDATPTIAYTNPGAVDTQLLTCDDLGTAVATLTAQTATDGLSPQFSSASSTSTTTIGVVFTETIDAIGDVAIGDFTLVNSGSGVLTGTPSLSGTTVTLNLSAAIVEGDTLTIAYAETDGDLEDANNNYVRTFTAQDISNNIVKETKGGSDCYDCTPPTLQESHITILSNDYVVATGDSPLHITANVGDKVTVILNVTDNKSVQSIPFAALYTNFEERPSDMNLFYANNFDNLKQVSTSFYEWNVRADDVPYDYDGTVSWSDNSPTVVTDVITADNFIFQNDDNVVQYFIIPFTFTINEHMESSQIVAKIYDASGNRLHVTLPITLETAGNESLSFGSSGNQKVLGFFDESVLYTIISESNASENITAQLSAVLGIPDESLPPWTSNLAKWVAEDKIDSADLIVAVEYLINQ